MEKSTNALKDLAMNAIKSINKVDGFDTDSLVSKIIVNNDGQTEEKQILLLPYKKAWARLKYPHYKIIYPVKETMNGIAHVVAHFYEDKNDGVDAYTGEGESFVYIDTTDARPADILINEALLKARGSAASRALTDAGFGLQYYIDEDVTTENTAKDENSQTNAVLKPVLRNETISDITKNSTAIPLDSDNEISSVELDLPDIAQDTFPMEAIKDIDAENTIASPDDSGKKEEKKKTQKKASSAKSVKWTCDFAKGLLADCGNLRGRKLGDLSAEEIFWIYSQSTDPTVRQGCLVLAKCIPDILNYFSANGIPV